MMDIPGTVNISLDSPHSSLATAGMDWRESRGMTPPSVSTIVEHYNNFTGSELYLEILNYA